MGKINLTKDAFLWCMAAIYLFAFVSLYCQIPGLYGDNGILPAHLKLKLDGKPAQKRFQKQPTLLWLLPSIGLDVPNGMDFICIVGAMVSLICMISRQMRDALMFATLWFLYLSVYQVGQTFLCFQWDILLLETGFLTILLAPLHLFKWREPAYHHHDPVMMWLLRWLLFRLMFASGVVKLTSMCPTWWDLTALNWHYESQCIPTPLAWYARQLPEWFQKLSVMMTYVIEIALPFLFFSPIRNLRLFAFFGQILLQVLIILTGNYNFFNLLTVTLCISLLDDQFFRRHGIKSSNTESQSSVLSRFVSRLSTTISVFVYVGLFYGILKYFDLSIDTEEYSVKSNVAFTPKDFFRALELVMPCTMALGVASLSLEILLAIWRCLSEGSGCLSKFWSLLQCLIMAAIAIGMFTISLVPHSLVDRAAYENLRPEIHTMKETTDFLHLTSSYGLFRRMTGVGGRPEVIIEGSNNPHSGWKPYEFLYKPGNVSVAPPFVAPHQPRLDWQMWFAALASNHQDWFLNLAYRLLDGQQEVLDLISHNPFAKRPPKYIRANLYHYSYTQYGSTNTNWWERTEAREYLPAIAKDNPSLMEYIKRSGIIKSVKKEDQPEEVTIAKEIVIQIRELIGHLTGPTLICSLFIPGVIISLF